MTFHAVPFLVLFLPVVVILYRAASALSRQGANLLLLAASIVFYAMNGVRSLPVIVLSLLINHVCGRGIATADEKGARRWLLLGIGLNVALLCWFKYPGLFPPAAEAARLTGNFGLPLGISFFTIQQIMYLMDIREQLAGPAPLLDHAQALFYFPYISAGPITRPSEIIRELRSDKRRPWAEDLGRGFARFALGLFKKVVIADNLAVVVGAGYGAMASLGFVEALVVCVCCTLQVYFDFSGYCDMAIGAGRMLGHTLPENFDNPLRASSISDFWQRWHMTLTTFITTYLYTPMVRAWGKVTRRKAMGATVAAMALAGVWHGSGWVFLVFGLLHGAGLAARLAWKASKRKMPDSAGVVLTFAFVTLAFIFFRAPTMAVAGHVLAALGGAHGLVSGASFPDNPIVIALRSNWGIPAAGCLLALGLAFLGPTSTKVAWEGRSIRLAMAVTPLLVISFFFVRSAPSKGFIYGDKQAGLQSLLSTADGVNAEGAFNGEKVVVGRDGWLFYSPGLTYVFGKPFLDAGFLQSRARQMVEKEHEMDPNPDPRPALFGLIEDCRRWGIHLVLAPVPDKAMLQPWQIGPSETAGVVPDNPSFGPLVQTMQEKGGDVFNWRPRSVRRGEARFLKRDTHWTPAFMEEYAARLAAHVSALGVLPPAPAEGRYRRLAESHSNQGDLASLLKLLPGPVQSSLESVDTHPVMDATTGRPVFPDRDAAALLLGDSFTNIYSLSSLAWGEHAGLAEQLAYNLNRPLDVLAMNGAGATQIRLELVRAAKQGRLSGKKAVIYEFAISDLAVENWRPARLPAPPAPPLPEQTQPEITHTKPVDSTRSAPLSSTANQANALAASNTRLAPASAAQPQEYAAASPQYPPAAAGEIQLIAEVTLVSRVPEPGVAPYKDCVGILKALVSSQSAELANKPILVALWVMRNDVLLEGAKYKPGDKLRMRLIPFENVDPIVRGTQRSDDTHDYDSPLFWATRVEVVPK